jgi:hypothetical protein
MQRVELVTGSVVAVVGAFALVEGLNLAFLSNSGIPGPGFFPILLSGLLILLGLILAGLSLRRQRVDTESPLAPVVAGEATASPAQRISTVDEATAAQDAKPSQGRRVLRAGSVWVLFAIAAGVLALLGFAPTVALLIAIVLYGVEGRRDWRPLVLAIVVPVAAYMLFVHVLAIPLPTGLLALGPLTSS